MTTLVATRRLAKIRYKMIRQLARHTTKSRECPRVDLTCQVLPTTDGRQMAINIRAFVMLSRLEKCCVSYEYKAPADTKSALEIVKKRNATT